MKLIKALIILAVLAAFASALSCSDRSCKVCSRYSLNVCSKCTADYYYSVANPDCSLYSSNNTSDILYIVSRIVVPTVLSIKTTLIILFVIWRIRRRRRMRNTIAAAKQKVIIDAASFHSPRIADGNSGYISSGQPPIVQGELSMTPITSVPNGMMQY